MISLGVRDGRRARRGPRGILVEKRIYHALFRHAIARSRRRWVLGLPSGGLADRPELAEASGWRRPSVGHGLPGYGIVPASG